jgi:hypothetical protein
LANRFRDLTQRSREGSDDAVAERMRGATLHLLGQQSEARDSLEKMLASYEEQSQRRHIVRFQYDQRLLAEVALARVLWLQGMAAESLGLVHRLIEKAKLLNHGPTYANILAEAACPIALMAEDFPLAEQFISLLRTQTRVQSMDVWRTYADAFEGELLIRRGEPQKGMDLIRPALATLRANGFVLYDMAFCGIVAVGLRSVGADDIAATKLELALAQCERTGEGWYLPELQRIRAEIHAAGGDRAVSEGLLKSALARAGEQGAGFWQANIETSLDRLPPSRMSKPQRKR